MVFVRYEKNKKLRVVLMRLVKKRILSNSIPFLYIIFKHLTNPILVFFCVIAKFIRIEYVDKFAIRQPFYTLNFFDL